MEPVDCLRACMIGLARALRRLIYDRRKYCSMSSDDSSYPVLMHEPCRLIETAQCLDMESCDSGRGWVQIRDERTRAILPVGARSTCAVNHAGMPVVARSCLVEMRRDGNPRCQNPALILSAPNAKDCIARPGFPLSGTVWAVLCRRQSVFPISEGWPGYLQHRTSESVAEARRDGPRGTSSALQF